MSRGSAANVTGYVRRSAERAPDRSALVFGSGPRGGLEVTFADLWNRADALSRGFEDAGVRPGDRILVMVPMSPGLYAVLIALLKTGAVAVFVDPWVGRRRIAAFAAFAGPRGYVGTAKSHLLRWLEPGLRRLPVSVTTGRRIWKIPARLTTRELARRHGDGSVHEVAPDDPALITFTSGSSGIPKGTNRTHGFLTAQHHALRDEFPYADIDVDMPMFPIFALNNLALGITSVIPDMDFRRVDAVHAERILGQMERYGVTTCTASPPFFDRLAQCIENQPHRHPRLRRILTGGAPVTDDQLRRWMGVLPDTDVVVVYGSTEAEPVAHLHASDRLAATHEAGAAARGFCAGRPSERVRARLIRIHRGPVELDERGWPAWEAPRGTVGELVVSGDHVARDYFRNPAAVRENKIQDRDGTVWHRMGDTGYLDDQDRFWLVGRVHSTIFRNGDLVHAQVVEQSAVGGDPRIRRAAAVGVPDLDLGERVVVVVETSERSPALRDEVEARLRAAEHVVDETVIVDRPLPVDPRHNSKIDYEAVRRMLAERADAGDARWS